ncbi:accessory Sec system glycosyltransferase Asp1 [Lactococcus termiticola]|uniref:Accessory Sec system protein Asp1 n=1 Tax=Lactococcus termiticola TaxID=2169526 RepID=A0A2R5HG97_9LACT|nr:accessory Sec system glycosyltransferase Asp1 [Lactococcus termiticola]GBG96355.1 hypothetical protein NtB2_00466 [Lactococcus termiticola]
MIYLMADWKADTQLDTDRIYHLSQFFTEEKLDHQLVLSGHVPNLLYKLNEYGYHQDNLIRVFDLLQGVERLSGHPLTIDELDIPSEYDRIYSPFGVMLWHDDRMVGYVIFDDYGFPTRVMFYKEDGAREEHTYDSRGFLSSIFYVNSGNVLVQRDYFDEFGRLRIHVDDTGFYLDGLEFPSQEAAVSMMLQAQLADGEDENVLISLSDETTLEEIKKLVEASKVKVISILSDKEQVHKVLKHKDVEMVIDSRVDQLPEALEAGHYIPIFYPELELGQSSEAPKLEIYAHFSKMEREEFKQLNMLIQKSSAKEDIALFVELEDPSQLDRVELMKREIIETHFDVDMDSDAYKKTEKYIVSKLAKKLFNSDLEAVKPLKETAQWPRLVGAVEAGLRINFADKNGLGILESKLDQVRLYLDLSDHYQIYRHAQVVSAGVPLISRHKSDYIRQGKNGIMLPESDLKLEEAIDHYLVNLKQWNEALVEAVDLIEAHHPKDIIKKWKELINNGEK